MSKDKAEREKKTHPPCAATTQVYNFQEKGMKDPFIRTLGTTKAVNICALSPQANVHLATTVDTCQSCLQR
uniref:Uncharacterized protein n=1 Tax=Anguilla anguilla TaxID=7936 RepID=A0A0E9WVT1_ANGAN